MRPRGAVETLGQGSERGLAYDGHLRRGNARAALVEFRASVPLALPARALDPRYDTDSRVSPSASIRWLRIL